MTFADQKQGTESTAAFTLDASRTPKEIDLTYEGPAEALKGLRQYGIYAIEDGKLTLCLTQPPATEEDRPKEFGTKAGAGHGMEAGAREGRRMRQCPHSGPMPTPGAAQAPGCSGGGKQSGGSDKPLPARGVLSPRRTWRIAPRAESASGVAARRRY
jgi:hypothetical protein